MCMTQWAIWWAGIWMRNPEVWLTWRAVRRCLLALPVLMTLAGCATMATLEEKESRNKIYSGTIRHVELKCAHASCLDAPFSVFLDTLLLPVTLPWTAYNYLAADQASKPPERVEEENNHPAATENLNDGH